MGVKRGGGGRSSLGRKGESFRVRRSKNEAFPAGPNRRTSPGKIKKEMAPAKKKKIGDTGGQQRSAPGSVSGGREGGEGAILPR